MSFDAWMNICGVTGVVLYLFAYWALMRQWCDRETPWNRALRSAGLLMLLTPLLLRWYMTESLLLLISGCIVIVSGSYILIRNRDRA